VQRDAGATERGGLKIRWVVIIRSALPLGTDIVSRTGHVRKVPEADIGKLFDQLVGGGD